MKVTITPGRAHGSVTVPSSKSYAHRMVLAAALASGRSVIRNVSFCEDILATLDCAAALGVKYSIDGDKIIIDGDDRGYSHTGLLPCRESGSTFRFFVPVALAIGGSFSFGGIPRLFERGIGLYEDALGSRGVTFERSETGITVSGQLTAGDYSLPGNVSSQYITGLLFALPMLSGDSTLTVIPPVESRKYIDITVEVLRRSGVIIEETQENSFFIKGDQTFSPIDAPVEGDWSGAAFLEALKYFGGDVELLGLDPESLQGDRIIVDLLRELDEPDPVIDISGCPDLGPVLFAAAAYKNGALFTGTRRLRIKESDRATVMAEELAKFGVRSEVLENSVRIAGGIKKPDELLLGHNDHRIVMSLAVLSTLTGGTIDGCEAIRKSYPGFFDDLSKLDLEIAYDD